MNRPPFSPETFEALSHKEPPKVAVGLTAVSSAVRHVLGQMPIAQGYRLLMKLNQKGGIDCPSCAWPDPDQHRSKLGEYCENGAKAIADEGTTKKADPEFFSKYSVEALSNQSDFWLGQQGRLTHPMVLREGASHYEPIAWDDAFALIAKHLHALASPNEAIFYTSGRSSNEAAFLYQLFVREFGTNNLPDCSNMCHESSGNALTETIGIGKGTVTLDDFADAEVIIIMGQNPGTNHPRMLNSLEQAKKNGAFIASVNPLVETGLLAYKNPQTPKGILGAGTPLTDLYLQIRINGDMALMKALMKLLLEAEDKAPGKVLDATFLQEKTEGFEAVKADLEQYSLSQLCADCGLELSAVRRLADVLAQKQRIIVCWAMGLTQHKNAVYTIREIVNLLLMKGSIGKAGAGVCPVRGHSNVQGDRTVGIFHLPPKKLIDKIKEVFGFDAPTEPGYDVVEAIQALHGRKARVLFALGGNLLAAAPDTHYTAQAFRNAELTVQVSTKLNRSHLITGKTALILPCLGRTDQDKQASGYQFVSTENSMGVVQLSQGILKPISDSLRSEPFIVAQLAHAVLGNRSKIDWLSLSQDYDRIRELIAKTIDGFAGMGQKLKEDKGFYLPNGPRQGIFPTASGRAMLTVNVWQPIILQEKELLLMTIRSHDQFNTTIYGLDDRYRGIYNERRVIFMNAADMEAQGLQQYDIVDIYSHYEGETRKADRFIAIPYSIPAQCVATYFPESNPLVPIQSMADRSHTPTSKSVIVTLKKIGRYDRQRHIPMYE